MADLLTKSEYYETTWKLLDCYFTEKNGYQLVKHLIDSYNDFVFRKIDDILQGFNPIEVHHQFLPEQQCFMYTLYVRLANPTMSKPMIIEKDGSTKPMTPTDARNRNVTYASNLTVDVHITAKIFNTVTNEYTTEEKQIENVGLGKLPVMVGSRYCILKTCPTMQNDECRYDFGGYFIINGNEKVVISQDRIAENKTYVFVNNKISTYSHVAEIRSVIENRFSVPKTTSLKLSSKPNQFGRYIRVNNHHIKHDVPLFILFRALGIESDKDIINYIISPSDPNYHIMCTELVGSIEESNNIMCMRDAREYLVRYMNVNGHPKELITSKPYRISILTNILENEFLPHVGTNLDKKAMYLGYMVNKLLGCYLGIYMFDDRDSYINKRIDTPGILMANLFRQLYGKVVKDMRNMIQKDISSGSWKATGKFINVINKVNIPKIIKSTTIESGLKFGLATGNWGIKSSKTKQGVAQVLNRMTYSATISHLRRINTPIEKTGKLVQPRKLHATQWGIICPSETPEGVGVGLVKNLAIMAGITVSSNSTYLRELLYQETSGLKVYTPGKIDIFNSGTRVFVNGDLVGSHLNPHELVKQVKAWKRVGTINIYTSVQWNIPKNEIWICTEGGRCVRPVYIINQNKLGLTPQLTEKIKHNQVKWHDLVHGTCGESLIEYLDVEETNTSMIAMRYSDLEKGFKGVRYPINYTHLEMDPSLFLGVLAGSIPFSNHNQAPRNTYQSSMGKQAIGVYTSNFRKRFDTIGHVLNYPQVPLVQTRAAKLINGDKLPCGINIIVAIATWTGFNQEDSIIMNKSSVDRGMFISTYYRTYKDQNTKNHSTGEEEYYCCPDPQKTKSLKPYNYDKLSMDGFVSENTFVVSGDVIIGKCMPQKNGSVISNKDSSIALKNNEAGYIDRNAYNDNLFTNINGDGYTFAKVRLRSDRIPTIGDKFSSRMGQKGTVGMIYDQADMPFSQTGMTPDIIINPHAIPSRMTIGQLMECIMGKACTAIGTTGDATPFTELTIEDIAKALDKTGIERYGNEILYNSRTGEMMACDIFMGPTYYQRLKHMTVDKIHSRAQNGPVVLLTRQPAEGRARDGGLRLGEMEVECNWAHGTMHFLKERTMDNSDNYRVFACKKCGIMANVNPDEGIYECKPCNNTTHFTEVRIPYACKLLLQEVQTMSIGAKIVT
jgi:DNA-directed RNA polymerase II subunit RPB2